MLTLTNSIKVQSVLLLLLLALSCLAFRPVMGQTPDLILSVDDVVIPPGEDQGVITVYMSNPTKSVCAIKLQLKMVPNLVTEFIIGVDTTLIPSYWKCIEPENWPPCKDSVPTTAELADWVSYDTIFQLGNMIDTAGTLISGWEFVSATGSEAALSMQVVGISDLGIPPGSGPRIEPQSGGVLFRLPVNVVENPADPGPERTTNVLFERFHDGLDVASCSGESIGWETNFVEDTIYFICDEWSMPDSSECLTSHRVFVGEPFDFFEVDTVAISVLDTNLLKVYDGTITVQEWICGDANDIGGSEPTIADIGIVIDHLFVSGAPIEPTDKADVNCSGDISVADIGLYIDKLFVSGAPFCCE